MIRNPGQKIIISDNSSGVSEIIGAILLISVGVLAVAIIAAGLFSQPLPQKIPDARFITEIKNNSLTIYHDGGEPLYRGEFFLKVNNVRIEDNAYTLNPGGGNIWSVGKSLKLLTSVPDDATVQIFYNTGSGEVLLDQVRIQTDLPLVPDVYIPPVPICPACNISNCSQTEIGDAFTQIVMNTSIIFEKASQGASLTNGKFFTFRVTKPGSTITIAGQNYNLQVGDTIKITLVGGPGTPHNFKAFGLGDRFFHLRGEKVDITLTYINLTSVPFNNKDIQNAWITGYVDLGSTLEIKSSGSAYTLLVINSTTPIINGVDTRTITISDIRPNGLGLFLLEEDSNAQEGINFVGNALSITY
jgi:hypothetical protein